MPVLSSVLLQAAHSPRVRRAVVGFPVTRRVVERFVAGESIEARGPRRAGAERRRSVCDARPPRRGHPRRRPGHARSVTPTSSCWSRAAPHGLTDRAEVSVKLSAFGQALPDGGEKLALENARAICEAAAAAGTTVTLDMEDHTTVDSTLARPARAAPATSRRPARCSRRCCSAPRRTAATWPPPGSRVRLVKGAYDEPRRRSPTRHKAEVDAAYVRCLSILMAGERLPDGRQRTTRG